MLVKLVAQYNRLVLTFSAILQLETINPTEHLTVRSFVDCTQTCTDRAHSRPRQKHVLFYQLFPTTILLEGQYKSMWNALVGRK